MSIGTVQVMIRVVGKDTSWVILDELLELMAAFGAGRARVVKEVGDSEGVEGCFEAFVD
jgi:hypothetical protein